MIDWRNDPHRRFNALTGEWILVSPHRLDRPWRGAVADAASSKRPSYDPTCPLCPGNERTSGARNPQYETTFVFDNDFAALRADTPRNDYADGLLHAQGEPGCCRVVCFSPRHDLDIAQMQEHEISGVIDTLAQEYRRLGAMPQIGAVTIFENRGAMMGASTPHPHAQIWAQRTPPNELVKESMTQREHFSRTAECLLCSYVRQELTLGERLVYENEHVAVVVPFWAAWPFEALVVPLRHAGALDALREAERCALSRALHALTSSYDRLFTTPFPYSMGFHQAPTDGEAHEEWHGHAHYFPPLLRSANVRKYMVGYELLAQPQRDLTAEAAAARLRDSVNAAFRT